MRPAFMNHHRRPSIQNFKVAEDPSLVGSSAPYDSIGGAVDDHHMTHDPQNPINIPVEEVDLPVPQCEDNSANRISVISSNRGSTMAQDSINTFLDDYYEVFQKNMKERVSKCEPSNLIYVNTCDVTQPPPTHYDLQILNRRSRHRQFIPNFDGEFSGLMPGVDSSYMSPTPSFNPRVPPPMFHRPNHVAGENIRLPPLHIPPPPLPVQHPLPRMTQPPLPPSPPPQPPPLPPSDKTEEMEFSSAIKSRRKSTNSDGGKLSSRHNMFSPPSISGRRNSKTEGLSSRTAVIEPSKLDLDSRIKMLLNDGPLGHLVPVRKSTSVSRKHSHRHESKITKPSPPSSHNTPLFEEHPDEPLSPPPSPFRSRAIYLKCHSVWVQRTLNASKNLMERTSETRPRKDKTQVIKTDKSTIGKKKYDVKKKLKEVLEQQKADVSWDDATQKRLESPQRPQDPDSTVDCALGEVAESRVQEAMVCDSSGSPAGTEGVTTTVQNVVQCVVGELTKDLKVELSNKLLDYMCSKVFENWGAMKSQDMQT